MAPKRINDAMKRYEAALEEIEGRAVKRDVKAVSAWLDIAIDAIVDDKAPPTDPKTVIVAAAGPVANGHYAQLSRLLQSVLSQSVLPQIRQIYIEQYKIAAEQLTGLYAIAPDLSTERYADLFIRSMEVLLEESTSDTYHKEVTGRFQKIIDKATKEGKTAEQQKALLRKQVEVEKDRLPTRLLVVEKSLNTMAVNRAFEDAGRLYEDEYRRESREAGHVNPQSDIVKIWNSKIDDDVRRTHRNMDGKYAPVESYFKFEDKYGELLHPFRPADALRLPVYEVANCRCILLYGKKPGGPGRGGKEGDDYFGDGAAGLVDDIEEFLDEVIMGLYEAERFANSVGEPIRVAAAGTVPLSVDPRVGETSRRLFDAVLNRAQASGREELLSDMLSMTPAEWEELVGDSLVKHEESKFKSVSVPVRKTPAKPNFGPLSAEMYDAVVVSVRRRNLQARLEPGNEKFANSAKVADEFLVGLMDMGPDEWETIVRESMLTVAPAAVCEGCQGGIWPAKIAKKSNGKTYCDDCFEELNGCGCDNH